MIFSRFSTFSPFGSGEQEFLGLIIWPELCHFFAVKKGQGMSRKEKLPEKAKLGRNSKPRFSLGMVLELRHHTPLMAWNRG